MRLLRVASLLGLLSAAVAPCALAADSRAFDVDHLQLAITSPEFLGVEGAGPTRTWGFQVGATWRFTTSTLMADGPTDEARALVAQRSLLEVAGGVTLWRRFGVALALPVLLQQSSDVIDGRAALGDLRLVARADAFSVRGFGGAVLLACRLPTGDTGRFIGQGSAMFEPRVALEWRGGIVRVGLNAGVRLREARSIGDLTIGNEVFAAAALGVRPLRWLDLFGEAHADTALSQDALRAATTPVELLAGLGGHVRGLAAQAAVGFGVVEGFGSPRVRVIVGLSYALEPRPPAPIAVVARPAPARPAPPSPPPAPPAPEADDASDEGDEGNVTVGHDFVTLADPVFFTKDSARIRSRFHGELTELAAAIRDRPYIKVLWIAGHTDSSGPAAWNRTLSERRARQVARFLIEQGVPPERVHTVGFGHSQPMSSDRRPGGRERNRRVAFLIERGGERQPGVSGPATPDPPSGSRERPARAPRITPPPSSGARGRASGGASAGTSAGGSP